MLFLDIGTFEQNNTCKQRVGHYDKTMLKPWSHVMLRVKFENRRSSGFKKDDV